MQIQMMPAEKKEKTSKNSISTIQPNNDENISPNIQTKSSQVISKEVKYEKCPEHNWKSILFYCNCGNFLCILCLKTHCHSNMNFCDIKSFYNNVLKEMEQILKLIDKYSDDLKGGESNTLNNKLESIMYTKSSLINLLNHREILYSLSLNQIKEVKDNNLFLKISNSISDYLEGVVSANEEKIKKLIKE
jgi:hypothetical protein